MADVVELLCSLIRNRCVNDGSPASGHEHRSVATLADYLGRPGAIIEPTQGRQSVIYRVEGTSRQAPSLLLLPHLDVVPANPSGWSIDPFSGVIADGFVWGRGAVDMLNLTAAMAVAFRPYLTGERAPLPGDLILAAVADEEAAGGLGAGYLAERHWDLVGAPYVLTEVAYPPLRTASGPIFPVAVGEKGPHWTTLRTRGTPGHGSAPYLADNAIAPLVSALDGLFTAPTPVVITPEWQAFVEGAGLGEAFSGGLLDPERIDGALAELAATDPGLARYAHAVTHLTISPNMVSAGEKANVIADLAEASIDIRAPVSIDRRDIDSLLRMAMGASRDRVEIEPVSDYPANTSPQDNPLWEAIGDAFEQKVGTRRLLPTLMPVATDARFWRTRGAVAYGVGWLDERVSFSEFHSLFHGNDERVSIESLHRTVELLGAVIEGFGQRWRP